MIGHAAGRSIDGGETLRANPLRMDRPAYQVIVVRAWRESEGVRIRLLADGGSARQWLVGSIDAACDLLGALLAELLEAPDRQATPLDTID
jgi:hypothetical protein